MAHETSLASSPVEIDRFIDDRETAHLIGSSRSWPWKLAYAGRFPKPIQLSKRCTRWRLSEVREWMSDPAGWPAGSRPTTDAPNPVADDEARADIAAATPLARPLNTRPAPKRRRGLRRPDPSPRTPSIAVSPKQASKVADSSTLAAARRTAK